MISISDPDTDAERWDMNRGHRLFVFPTDLETALGSLASTMLLFEPTLTQGILRQLKLKHVLVHFKIEQLQ